MDVTPYECGRRQGFEILVLDSLEDGDADLGLGGDLMQCDTLGGSMKSEMRAGLRERIWSVADHHLSS